MTALTDAEIEEALPALPGWKLDGGKLATRLDFPDFLQAMEFVNRVAEVAEKEGHHPDIDIRYNHVTLGLITHDAGGITQKDVMLAHRLHTLAAKA